MTTDARGMDIQEYMGQDAYWIDPRSKAVFEISGMDPNRRSSAARNLTRMATALISLAEASALRHGDIAEALHLAHQEPRRWIVATPLYRALYPAPAGVSGIGEVNRNPGLGVVQMGDVRRLA